MTDEVADPMGRRAPFLPSLAAALGVLVWIFGLSAVFSLVGSLAALASRAWQRRSTYGEA